MTKPVHLIFKNVDTDFEVGMMRDKPENIKHRARYYGVTRKVDVNFLYHNEIGERSVDLAPTSAVGFDVGLLMFGLEYAALFNTSLNILCKDQTRIKVSPNDVANIMRKSTPSVSGERPAPSRASKLSAMFHSLKTEYCAHKKKWSANAEMLSEQLELFPDYDIENNVPIYKIGHRNYNERLAA